MHFDFPVPGIRLEVSLIPRLTTLFQVMENVSVVCVCVPRGIPMKTVDVQHRRKPVEVLTEGYSVNEPRHDKTNKVTVRPAKTQISLGIRPV